MNQLLKINVKNTMTLKKSQSTVINIDDRVDFLDFSRSQAPLMRYIGRKHYLIVHLYSKAICFTEIEKTTQKS